MKQLLENWREFVLTEKLLLKPGPTGWDLYGQLASEAYAAAPEFEASAVSSFEALAPFVEKMFRQLQSKVEVQFVDEIPYKDDQEMKQDVMQNSILKIWTGGTEHAVFDPELNQKFRAVHDWMAHVQPGGLIHGGTDFTMKGEIQAFNAHMKTIPLAGAPALFTEVIGQAAFFINNGYFPEQKIAILPGFDYFNIGVVDGYDIVNKELVEK